MTPFDSSGQPSGLPAGGLVGKGAAAALDSLVESAFDHDESGQSWSPEGRKLTGLLGLLDGPLTGGPGLLAAGGSTLLVDVTMARLMRESEKDLAGRIHPIPASAVLSASATASVDSLVDSAWDGGEGPASSLLGLLEVGAAAPTPAERAHLIASTLAHVQQQIEGGRRRYRLAPERHGSSARRGIRLTDLGALAAMLLLGAAVLWPIVSSSAHQTREQNCAANLSRAAMGFSLYAGDNKGELPRARESFQGGTWWNVGDAKRSHSANLYVLVKRGYTSLGDLSCPGNANATVQQTDSAASDWRTPQEVSFSYQLFGPGRPGWGQGSRIVVLADQSPVVLRARRGEVCDPATCSRNHDGRGQNILFSDGSVRFHTRPILENGDNIWLPKSEEAARLPLTGRETPRDDRDAFVGP